MKNSKADESLLVKTGKSYFENSMKFKFYIITFLLLCSKLLYADEVNFRTSVSSQQVATGEDFRVTFTLNTKGSNFSAPDFNGFQVLSGPNQSSSMSWINGVSSSSISFSYYLRAVKTGEYQIGAASIVVDGKKISSNAVKIVVVKGEAVQQNPSTNSSQPQRVSSSKSNDINKQLIIRAIPDKTNAYIGEQISVTYKLYTQLSIGDNGVDKLPDLNGFWSEEIKIDNQQPEWKQEVYNGENYHVATIRRMLLFPQRAGSLTIDPLAMSFIVRISRPARDIMDAYFGAYEDIKHSTKSAAVKINVKELPEVGKPEGFTGAVGDFKVSASLDKNETKANEPLNYKLDISGSGNIKLLNAPKLNLPSDFEKYDPTITDQLSVTAQGVSGKRSYNFLIIPRHEGDFSIPAYSFSYFNPLTKKYVILNTEEFRVKVLKGDVVANNNSLNANNQTEVKVLDKDIRYIKTESNSLNSIDEVFLGSPLYYSLISIGPLAFLLALFIKKRTDQNNSDIVKVKSRKAGKVAAKYLEEAQKQLDLSNSKEFYEAIFKGLYGYLSNKLNIEMADMNKEIITKYLEVKISDQAVIQNLIEVLDTCEMARFAPVSSLAEKEVFDKAKNIINDIESKISSNG
jgi:hypothetical protein